MAQILNVLSHLANVGPDSIVGITDDQFLVSEKVDLLPCVAVLKNVLGIPLQVCTRYFVVRQIC